MNPTHEVGAFVYHRNQEWARAHLLGTAVVVARQRSRGRFVYQVRTGQEFSRPPGPGNPQDRETDWPEHTVCPARGIEDRDTLARIMERLEALTPQDRVDLANRTQHALDGHDPDAGPRPLQTIRLADALMMVEISGWFNVND